MSEKKVKVEGVGELKKNMTAERKAVLAACKSFYADVERAKEILQLATCVRRHMCNTCKNDGCKVTGPNERCKLASIFSVAVGMILEAKGGAK